MFSRVFMVMAATGAISLAGDHAHAQQTTPARPLITQALNEHQLVPLAGNTRPDARAAAKSPAVADGTRLEHIQMLLRRSPEREEAAASFVDGLSKSGSPSYHRWLTAAEYGRRFGASPPVSRGSPAGSRRRASPGT